ncbi:MAG: DNA methylase [Clostridia bacterium]|nr:DNA methylase [Clostridia bacterium]
MERKYIAIDLKSFYASVECRDRGLDPLTTNLVVADISRTEKTIGLAVSPSLKSFGIPGRPRLFEVVARVKEVNLERRAQAGGRLSGKSYDYVQLKKNPALAVDYITAPPRMARYIEYSTEIYKVYLKYVSAEDIHVYSIDEVFMDVTRYLKSYRMTARELCEKIISDVLSETGITATAGIGTNLYLAKVSMDIVAKHLPADGRGVRIAELDEMSYRKLLWNHRPLTDFWRVGPGYSKRLESMGLFTMGDIARCSIGNEREYYNEELLYKAFGVNAELLIDHAWGYESCTMGDIKAYKPSASSLGSGQVLHCAYEFEKARLVTLEMADQLSLDLVEKGLVCDGITLTVGYDAENAKSDNRGLELTRDYYGRAVPKHAHGTKRFKNHTSLTSEILDAAGSLFDEIVNKNLLIRRIALTACNTFSEEELKKIPKGEQIDMFSEEELIADNNEEKRRERQIQNALLDIKHKYGKNAIVKGMSLEDGATGIDRNRQIGGHKA